jgi:hypothetical protein
VPGNWPAWFGPGPLEKDPPQGGHLASGPPVCHACLSTWLNAGVSAPQTADWAGHSVDVLLRVYAKCIAGQQEDAKRRIEKATRPHENQ